MRLLAEASCEQVIDMLGDVAAPAVADPDERGKLAYLLARLPVRADERAEQFQGAFGLFLAEPADEQLQPLPRCHTLSLTADAATDRVPRVIRLRTTRTEGAPYMPGLPPFCHSRFPYSQLCARRFVKMLIGELGQRARSPQLPGLTARWHTRKASLTCDRAMRAGDGNRTRMTSLEGSGYGSAQRRQCRSRGIPRCRE